MKLFLKALVLSCLLAFGTANVSCVKEAIKKVVSQSQTIEYVLDKDNDITLSMVIPGDMPNFFAPPFTMTYLAPFNDISFMANFTLPEGDRYSIIVFVYPNGHFRVAGVYDAQKKNFWIYPEEGKLGAIATKEEAQKFLDEVADEVLSSQGV